MVPDSDSAVVFACVLAVVPDCVSAVVPDFVSMAPLSHLGEGSHLVEGWTVDAYAYAYAYAYALGTKVVGIRGWETDIFVSGNIVAKLPH